MSDSPNSAGRPAADAIDPRGLIRDAFAMPGLAEADCRSIFFDWALGLPPEVDYPAAIVALTARHADAPAEHAMHRVLSEGLEPPRRTRRRRRRGGTEPPA